MSRKTSPVAGGDTAKIEQYNNLRDEAYASSMFLCIQQATPNLTLKVSPGSCYINGVRVDYAGGNSPSFTAPVTHPRIDLLTINSAGTLVRNAGVEASSPAEPTCPVNEIPICLVYNRVGQTSIKETDDSSNGYIYKDVRNFLVGGNIKVDRYESGSGTWKKPTGAKKILLQLWGAGGGGDRGAPNNNFTFSGGSGGGGGAYVEKIYDADDIGASLEYSVGAGGKGGLFAKPPTDGGNTTITTLGLVAGGGARGSASYEYDVPGGSGGGEGSVGLVEGEGGGIYPKLYSEIIGTHANIKKGNAIGGLGAGATRGGVAGCGFFGGGCGGGGIRGDNGLNGGGSLYGGAGGGAGGGNKQSPSSATYTGGAGGKRKSYSVGGGAAGGTPASKDGADGTDGAFATGGGGGLGGGSDLTKAGKGGKGGTPACGGGGGGSIWWTQYQDAAGDGGDGGDGLIIITTWF